MSNGHMPPLTHQELVLQMKENFNGFLSTCEALTPEQALEPGVCGDWSAKAVVDHLTGWQVQSLSILQLLSNENEPFEYDIDAFNSTSVKSREDLSWDESLAVFESSFQDFDEAVREVPSSQVRANKGFAAWLKAMIQEYRFHLQHIEEAQRRIL